MLKRFSRQINNESPISIEFDSNIPISEDISPNTPICLNSSSIRQNLLTKETLSQPPDIHELEKQKNVCVNVVQILIREHLSVNVF